MNDPGHSPRLRGPLAAAGAAVAMIACCVLPVLIAAGALTGLGAALRSWGPIAAAALVVLGAFVYVSRRRTHGSDGQADGCCAPTGEDPGPFTDPTKRHHRP